jgi:1-deoxy-D-xylulose-5-phosphate synthase
MSENGYSAKIKKLGIPDYYVEQGTIAELHHECGFDKEGIVKALTDLLTD